MILREMLVDDLDQVMKIENECRTAGSYHDPS